MKMLSWAASIIAVITSSADLFAQAATNSSAPAGTEIKASSAPSQQQAAQGATYMNIGFVALTDFGWTSAKDVRALLPGDRTLEDAVIGAIA